MCEMILIIRMMFHFIDKCFYSDISTKTTT